MAGCFGWVKPKQEQKVENVFENGADDSKVFLKEVNVSGNAFITQYTGAGSPVEEIEREGLGIVNWFSTETVWSVYFRISRGETVSVGLRLRLLEGTRSLIRFSYPAGGIEKDINISSDAGGGYQTIGIGQIDLPESGGYVQFDFRGLERTGAFFAQVTHLLIAHADLSNQIVFNTVAESYWGRRGPSVHLRYPEPTDPPTEYFYNEVRIPPGSDNIGLYAMACGFSGGYFGMQVNGSSERRILFSIWSEFNSDDPEQIPDDYKVQLVRRGKGVYVGEFGNEGSGAQSFVRFNWKTGSTYKFLVQAKPVDADNTLYTAWFRRPEEESKAGWMLVASFKKPKVSIHLKSLYSFLENFEPELGHLERAALFGNQWARTAEGKWVELTEAIFTGDATSEMGRKDFAGGLTVDGSNKFYLRHCGFFSDLVPTKQTFFRRAEGVVPEVDVEALP